jgi:hypothetical protein
LGEAVSERDVSPDVPTLFERLKVLMEREMPEFSAND